MKKRLIPLLVVAVVDIAAIGLVAGEHGEGHEGYEREHEGENERFEPGIRSGSAYTSDLGYGVYKTECGSCHLAYPPSMLPGASWQRMMGTLADHFGDNAELDAQSTRQITEFLTRNSAGDGRGRYAEGAWRSTRGRAPPLRITATDYFRGRHHEIPAKMVRDNPGVGSFARCETCHTGAEQGNFEEDGVRIPGFGRWDD
jgi:hypothetical protein